MSADKDAKLQSQLARCPASVRDHVRHLERVADDLRHELSMIGCHEAGESLTQTMERSGLDRTLDFHFDDGWEYVARVAVKSVDTWKPPLSDEVRVRPLPSHRSDITNINPGAIRVSSGIGMLRITPVAANVVEIEVFR